MVLLTTENEYEKIKTEKRKTKKNEQNEIDVQEIRFFSLVLLHSSCFLLFSLVMMMVVVMVDVLHHHHHIRISSKLRQNSRNKQTVHIQFIFIPDIF